MFCDGLSVLSNNVFLIYTFIGQDSGGKIIQQSLGAAQLQQEKGIGSSPIQQNIQVGGTFLSIPLSKE